MRGDPAVATASGVIGFAAATTVCAVAPSLGVLIAARAAQAAGGALVIVGCLELLVAAAGVERAGVRRWAAAGVAGAALGPVTGGLLTSAFSWRAIFVVQIPIVLLALPAAIALRGRVVERRRPTLDTSPDHPHVLANLALALLSAALTAALFLLVLLLVDGWSRSPAVAAVAVTAVPVAAVAAGPVFRGVRAGTRSEAVAGSVLIAGGLTALALLPGAKLVWTIAPQVLVGLGLGLSVDSLTAAALRDRIPRALHGGWTIAARHAGVVVGLTILTPIFTADLRHAQTPAEEAIAGLVLDAPLPVSTKLDLDEALGRRLSANAAGCPTCGPRSRACECRRRRRPPSPPWSVASSISSSAPPPARSARRSSSRGDWRCWRSGLRWHCATDSLMRRLALPLIALVLVAAVLGIQVAAGGGHYVPLRPANPCSRARFPPSRRGSNRPADRSSCSASRAPHVGSASPASASSSHSRRPAHWTPASPPRSRRASSMRSTCSTARAGCPRCPSCFHKRSIRPISPGSSRRSSERFRPGRRQPAPDRTAAAPDHRCARHQPAPPRAQRPEPAGLRPPVGDPAGRPAPDP